MKATGNPDMGPRVDADLHVWEAGSHGGFFQMAPADAERTAEVRRFAERCWS